MEESPQAMLISIAVVAYNSAPTIIETLESVKAQTYANLELIISDDCSKDNTVDICKSWIDTNSDRFIRVELLCSTTNMGIAPNRNKCINASKGEWIKFVDGDDMLTDNSIASYLKAISPDTDFIVGNYFTFNEKNEVSEKKVEIPFFSLSPQEQLKRQELKAIITWPGIFLKRSTTLRIGGLNERYPMLDDFPFFIRALEHSCKFAAINEFVFRYRVHSGSAQRSFGFHKSHVYYVNEIIVPKYKKQKRYIHYWHDLLWSEKEIAKIEQKCNKAFFLKTLMLFTDLREWYFIIRDKIYRPLVFAIRK